MATYGEEETNIYINKKIKNIYSEKGFKKL